MAASRFRSPDPSLNYRKRLVTRRLAPNSRKLTFAEIAVALREQLIAAMAAELAAIHAGDEKDRLRIQTDLAHRKRGWLNTAAARVAEWTAGEHAAYAAAG